MNIKRTQLTLQRISWIAILSALCAVFRYAFATLPNIQPITAIFLIVSIIFGIGDSLLIMAVTMLVSSFLLGFGPWVFFQILSFALVLCLWRFLLYPLTKILKFDKIKTVTLQAFLAGMMGIIYGLVIDSCYAFLYNMPWWSYVLAGASFNLVHALSTLLFYPLLLPILRRFSDEKVV